MEREVGGGIGMGNTCKPMAVSFQCMTKFTTNKKKIKNKNKKKTIKCSLAIKIDIETEEQIGSSKEQNSNIFNDQTR